MLKRLCGAILGCLIATSAMADPGFNSATTVMIMKQHQHGVTCKPIPEGLEFLDKSGFVLTDTQRGKEHSYQFFTLGDNFIATSMDDSVICIRAVGTFDYDEEEV